MAMMRIMMMCLVAACFLSAGFAASGHAFACKCEGSLVHDGISGAGVDWLDKKTECGHGYSGGEKGRIINNVKDPNNFMSSKYYNGIINGTVASAYDPDSGWRCVNRNTY